MNSNNNNGDDIYVNDNTYGTPPPPSTPKDPPQTMGWFRGLFSTTKATPAATTMTRTEEQTGDDRKHTETTGTTGSTSTSTSTTTTTTTTAALFPSTNGRQQQSFTPSPTLQLPHVRQQKHQQLSLHGRVVGMGDSTIGTQHVGSAAAVVAGYPATNAFPATTTTTTPFRTSNYSTYHYYNYNNTHNNMSMDTSHDTDNDDLFTSPDQYPPPPNTNGDSGWGNNNISSSSENRNRNRNRNRNEHTDDDDRKMPARSSATPGGSSLLAYGRLSQADAVPPYSNMSQTRFMNSHIIIRPVVPSHNTTGSSSWSQLRPSSMAPSTTASAQHPTALESTLTMNKKQRPKYRPKSVSIGGKFKVIDKSIVSRRTNSSFPIRGAIARQSSDLLYQPKETQARQKSLDEILRDVYNNMDDDSNHSQRQIQQPQQQYHPPPPPQSFHQRRLQEQQQQRLSGNVHFARSMNRKSWLLPLAPSPPPPPSSPGRHRANRSSYKNTAMEGNGFRDRSNILHHNSNNNSEEAETKLTPNKRFREVRFSDDVDANTAAPLSSSLPVRNEWNDDDDDDNNNSARITDQESTTNGMMDHSGSRHSSSTGSVRGRKERSSLTYEEDRQRARRIIPSIPLSCMSNNDIDFTSMIVPLAASHSHTDSTATSMDTLRQRRGNRYHFPHAVVLDDGIDRLNDVVLRQEDMDENQQIFKSRLEENRKKEATYIVYAPDDANDDETANEATAINNTATGWNDIFGNLYANKWKCAACSIFNDNDKTACVSCETKRSPSESATQQSTTSAVPAPSTTGTATGTISSSGFTFTGSTTAPVGPVVVGGFTFGVASTATGSTVTSAAPALNPVVGVGGFTFPPITNTIPASSNIATGGFTFSATTATTEHTALAASAPAPATSSPFIFAAPSSSTAIIPPTNVGFGNGENESTPHSGLNGNLAASATSATLAAPPFIFGNTNGSSAPSVPFPSSTTTLNAPNSPSRQNDADSKPKFTPFVFGSNTTGNAPTSNTALESSGTETPAFVFGGGQTAPLSSTGDTTSQRAVPPFSFNAATNSVGVGDGQGFSTSTAAATDTSRPFVFGATTSNTNATPVTTNNADTFQPFVFNQNATSQPNNSAAPAIPFVFGLTNNPARSMPPPAMHQPSQQVNGGTTPAPFSTISSLAQAAPSLGMVPSTGATSATPLFGTSAAPPLYQNSSTSNATSSNINHVSSVPPLAGGFVFGSSSNTVPAQSNTSMPQSSTGFGAGSFSQSNQVPATAQVSFPSFGQAGNSITAFGSTNTGYGTSAGMNATTSSNSVGFTQPITFGHPAPSNPGFPSIANVAPPAYNNNGGFGANTVPNQAPPPPAFGSNISSHAPAFGIAASTPNQGFQVGSAGTQQRRKFVRARRPV